MKKKIFLIFLLTAILIPNDNLKDKIVVEYSDETSSFIYNDIEYKIVLDATLYHNEYYVDNKLFIEYIVYKDDVEIYSNDESNYIYADCDYEKGGPFKYHYEIDFIQKDKSFVTINDNYGWIIYTGGICGNTFSYQSDIIISPLESGNEIITSNQFFKAE